MISEQIAASSFSVAFRWNDEKFNKDSTRTGSAKYLYRTLTPSFYIIQQTAAAITICEYTLKFKANSSFYVPATIGCNV